MSDFTFYIFIAGFIILMMIFISESRKGTITGTKASEGVNIITTLSPSETFKAIIKNLNTSRYSIDDIEENKYMLVLSDRYSLASGGYYYTVSCSTDVNKTKIEIGIKGKIIHGTQNSQIHLDRFVNLIRAAILVEI